jgi:hypothetical protein
VNGESVNLQIPAADAAELRDGLKRVGLTAELAGAPPAKPRSGWDFRPGRELESTLPSLEMIAVSLASPAALAALAAVIREHIRSKRTRVWVKRADGSELEIDANLTDRQIERLIDGSDPGE